MVIFTKNIIRNLLLKNHLILQIVSNNYVILVRYQPMNILICLLWIKIMTQVPSKPIIFKEYPRIKRKKSSFNPNETNIMIHQTSLTMQSPIETITQWTTLSRTLQKESRELTMFPINAIKKEKVYRTPMRGLLENSTDKIEKTKGLKILQNPTSKRITFVTKETHASTKNTNISHILIEGPINLISSIPLEEIAEALNLLEDIDIIPENHIMEVWSKVQGTKPLEALNVEDVKKMGDFMQWIPDYHLFYLNMSDWDLVEYLGKIKKFEKHKQGILTASLLKAHGFEILRNHSTINRMFGIICGFDWELLKNIPDHEFRQIDGEVFNCLHSCSQSQRRNLLQKATKPTIFGPPQVWKAETVEKANMLILALTPKELRSIRPPAMKGMKPPIIKLMSFELIMAFNSKQLSYLSTAAYLAYKERIFLSSKQLYHKSNISYNILLFVSFLLYLELER